MSIDRNRNWSIQLINETNGKKLAYFAEEMGLELAKRYKTGLVNFWKKRRKNLETAKEYSFNGVVYAIELNDYCCGVVQLRCAGDKSPKGALCYTPKAADDFMFKNIYISPKFRQLGGFRSVFELVERKHLITAIQLYKEEIRNHAVFLKEKRFGTAGIEELGDDNNQGYFNLYRENIVELLYNRLVVGA
jgi:hypothetical protein